MYTERLSIPWPAFSSRTLLSCLIGILVFDSTYARPIYTELEHCKEAKTKFPLSRNARGSRPQPVSSCILNSRAAHPNNNTEETDHKGAIIGGTIVAGIIFGLVVFMCFKIRKEYLLSRQRQCPVVAQANQASVVTPRNRKEVKHSLKDRLSNISAALSHRGEALKRAVSRNDDTSSTSSDLSFGDLATPPTILETTNPGPFTPPKATDALGFRCSEATTRVPSTPIPPMATTTPPPRAHKPYWESGQKATANSQPFLPRPNSSSSSLSSLGRSLLQDTMHPPEPQKYSIAPIPQRPLPPLPPPTPPPAPLADSDEGIRRGQSRRYFVPVFGAEGRSPSPTSPPERMGVGDRQRESWQTSPYNVI